MSILLAADSGLFLVVLALSLLFLSMSIDLLNSPSLSPCRIILTEIVVIYTFVVAIGRVHFVSGGNGVKFELILHGFDGPGV